MLISQSNRFKFTNACGTYANIKTIGTSLLLLRNQHLTGDEISQGLTAYTLVCRENKSDYMHLTFEKVQRALRVSAPQANQTAGQPRDGPQNPAGVVQENGKAP